MHTYCTLYVHGVYCRFGEYCVNGKLPRTQSILLSWQLKLLFTLYTTFTQSHTHSSIFLTAYPIHCQRGAGNYPSCQGTPRVVLHGQHRETANNLRSQSHLLQLAEHTHSLIHYSMHAALVSTTISCQ